MMVYITLSVWYSILDLTLYITFIFLQTYCYAHITVPFAINYIIQDEKSLTIFTISCILPAVA